MRTSKRGWQGAAALALTMIAVGGVAAVIADWPASQDKQPENRFASAKEAYRSGVSSLAAENMSKAVAALEFAADRGILGAQLRLARIYSSGDEARRDPAKALTYYHMVVNEHGDIDRLHPAAGHVSDAFRGLARYYRDGLPEIGLEPNARKAAQLVRHAASYFRDPRAQFQIGKMYAEGHGVVRSRGLAASWLLKASQKKYALAQAYLGELLWHASDAERLRAQGLAMLALALSNASESEHPGLEKRYRVVGETADAAMIEKARRYVVVWDGFRAEDTSRSASAFLASLGASPVTAVHTESLAVAATDAPVVVGDPEGNSAAAALMRDIRLHLPFDMRAGYDSQTSGVSDPSQAVDQFFVDRSSFGRGELSEDIFADVEIHRFGGETLSVDAELPEK